jgi:hypothetical protein
MSMLGTSICNYGNIYVNDLHVNRGHVNTTTTVFHYGFIGEVLGMSEVTLCLSMRSISYRVQILREINYIEIAIYAGNK